MSDTNNDWSPEEALQRVATAAGMSLSEYKAYLKGMARGYGYATEAQFCRFCGASIPHRIGEGRCEKCAHHAAPTAIVQGVLRHE